MQVLHPICKKKNLLFQDITTLDKSLNSFIRLLTKAILETILSLVEYCIEFTEVNQMLLEFVVLLNSRLVEFEYKGLMYFILNFKILSYFFQRMAFNLVPLKNSEDLYPTKSYFS